PDTGRHPGRMLVRVGRLEELLSIGQPSYPWHRGLTFLKDRLEKATSGNPHMTAAATTLTGDSDSQVEALFGSGSGG
ncbi:MAG: hypothetical protein M3492_07495, partial [Actinomycetota bacterium]|nr:hypothetical protein [Actinomycetota bacterium]